MNHKSGYAAIIGKPNAGKSTLMNRILGRRISITTHKPQTTRHQILGIHSEDDLQIIFLDTPGIITPKYELQRAMMQTVKRARRDADVVLFIVDVTDADVKQSVFDLFRSIQKPVVLVINKIDQVSDEEAEEVARQLNEKNRFEETCYVSALQGKGMEALMMQLKERLPEGPAYYPKDILSEQPVRFFATELIREQLYLQFHQEIPYSCTVNIVKYDARDDLDYINAEVVVNKKSQKGMLIGKGGRAIKKLGKNSREKIEALIEKKVYLDLRVKVREKWRDSSNKVRNFGY